MKFVFKT